MKGKLTIMAEDTAPQPALRIDKPVERREDDLYDRAAYVQDLAKALRGFDSQEGLIIGIDGPWGSGKTSLKNMLIEQLNNTSDSTKPIPVVEFNPWMYSGSGRLISLMFERISRTLCPKRSYIKRMLLKLGKPVSSLCSMAQRATGWLPTGYTFILGLVAEAFRTYGKAVDPDSRDIGKLSKRREELTRQLERLKTRIIVFIDDLDRLMDDEVVDMLRAVKAVGDLPCVTYVLLYDRDAITKALDKNCHDKGAEYLEKIIQVPIGLPKPPDEAVQERLKKELARIVGEKAYTIYEKNIPDLFDPTGGVYDSCVLPFIRSIRDVIRLSNEFGLRYQVLKDDVEGRDLLGITTLEVFRPHLHRWIMGNKHLLCSPSEDQIRNNQDGVEDRAKGLKTRLDKFFSENEETTELERKDRKAIESLFPVAHYAEAGLQSVIDLAYKGEYRNIYHPAHFDAYFRLSIGRNLLHESQYTRFLLDDPLDENDLDREHWEILTDPNFPKNAGKYLRNNEYDAVRAAKIVGFCLDLESKFGSGYQQCPSLQAAVSIMNAAEEKQKLVEYMDEVLRAIIESGTIVSMPVAAFLAADIHHAIHEHNETSTPRLFFLMSEYKYHSLVVFQEPEETRKCEQRWLQRLHDHLKTPQKKQGKLPSPAIIRIYANAIPYLYETDDSETSKDEYPAFATFKQLMPEDRFSIYAAEALTQQSGDSYVMNLPLLRKLIKPETYQSAFKAWKTDYSFHDSIPCDHHCLVACATAIGNPDAPATMSKREVDNAWAKMQSR